MQPSQQLQWKRQQQQQCLDSRKRKVSELFSVTADPNLDDYNAKLKAFHDANDLKSGRRFDESTLPPRTQFSRIRQGTKSSLLSRIRSAAALVSQRSATPPVPTSNVPSKDEPASRALISERIPPSSDSQVDSGFGVTDTRAEADRDTANHIETQILNGPGTRPGSLSSETGQLNAANTPQSQDAEHARGLVQDVDIATEVDEQPATMDARSRDRSPTTSSVTATLPGPSVNDISSSGRFRPEVVSPATSPADGSQEDMPTASKNVDIPKQPDTPDSTQQIQAEDPSSMDIDAAVDGMTTTDKTKPTESRTAPDTSSTRDGTLQRPPVRLDTNNSGSYFKQSENPAVVESPAPMTGAGGTPRRSLPPTPSVQDSSKRATRISSGVLQKKSVSDILNEAQRSQSDSPHSESRDSAAALERREKDRTKLSTVVFAKAQKPEAENDMIRVDTHAPGSPKERDYLYTLFENKAHSMHRNGSMNYLIANAHKTLSTADHLVDYEMQSHCRVLKRIYQLQERGRWALRQHKRSEEPPRPTSHWDILLDHAKWMRTDFREERKWKLAAARGLAEECAEWVQSSDEVRRVMQVKVRSPTFLPASNEHKQDEDIEMSEEASALISSHPTPDLIPSSEDDSMSEDVADPRDIVSAVPPAAIFSLAASDYTFQVDKTPAFEKILNELPVYEPAPIIPDYSKSDLAARLDARWKTDIIPVSKYAVEKLVVKDERPVRKRRRYEYDLEMSPTRRSEPMPPQEQNVALFMTENKHIRDRIHPGHSFRPPTEYPMPTQEFFQTRTSSQWTTAEDDELRKLVKDYSYNWSQISSFLTSKNLYMSGAERRTPWECFERWIGLEGLPADMSKTPYFKTYSGRIEAAGRHVLAQIEEAQRRAGANVPIPARKRTTQPVRVDRKRNQRHLAMLDGMRKLAKKRELAVQKQQHQSEVAAMRKLNSSEINQPKAPFKRPQEYAALRQERDQKRAEQQEMYRQQLLAHQRAAQQRGGNAGMNGLPNGLPNPPNGLRVATGGMPGMPNGNLQVPNTGRPHPAVMAAMNGMQMPPGMPKNIQAQMQANMVARGMAPSPEQIRMMQQASKVQQQQEMMRQAQQNGQQSSPSGPSAPLTNGNYNMPNGAGSPPNVNGDATSPRSATTGQLSSGHVPVLNQIANKIKQQFPNMSDEDVQRHATQQIQMWQQQATGSGQKRPQAQNQAALNAAMGAANSAAHASNNAANANFAQSMQQLTPEQMQMYQAQRMRMLQAQQQNGAVRQAQGGAQGMNMGMPNQLMAGQGQMAANSPVMNMARPVSQGHGAAGMQQTQQQLSRSVTPSVRDGRSGSLGAQQVPGMGSPSQGMQQMARPGSSRGMQVQGQQQTPIPTGLQQGMNGGSATGPASPLPGQMQSQQQPLTQQNGSS